MILFDNKYACISFDKEVNAVVIAWKEYAPSHEYREAVSALYQFRRELSVADLLCDSRYLPTISAADSYWTAEIAKLYYDSVDQGYVAMIVSESSFSRLAIQSIENELRAMSKNFSSKVVYRYFTTCKEGVIWLIRKSLE